MEDFKDVEALRYFIFAAEREGNRRFHEKLKNLGITASQAEVLRVLQDEAPLTLKELGERLVCEHGSPSRLVERLVKEGFVSKTQSTSDGRAVLISLTTVGENAAKEVLQIEKRIYSSMSNAIPEEMLMELNELLGKLLDLLPVGAVLRKRGFITDFDDQGEAK